jgi:hypothetical protein
MFFPVMTLPIKEISLTEAYILVDILIKRGRNLAFLAGSPGT